MGFLTGNPGPYINYKKFFGNNQVKDSLDRSLSKVLWLHLLIEIVAVFSCGALYFLKYTGMFYTQQQYIFPVPALLFSKEE
jgi:hypothetical protein